MSSTQVNEPIISERDEPEVTEDVFEVTEERMRNLAEVYLTLPEEIIALTEIPELEDAVERCKDMVLESPDNSEEKGFLVRRLIELRLRLHDVKEALKDEEMVNETLKERTVVLGHHFQRQSHHKSIAAHYCDRCSKIIFNTIHVWNLCIDCEYKCHVWCLKQVGRVCAHVLVTETPSYILDICPEPENGLASQNYRCAECLNRTSFRETILEPRLCDYNGKYYCPTCHWNSYAVIPARVIMNWDFKERRVCRASKQILRMLSKLPIIRFMDLNPILFATVDDLHTVLELRRRLLKMKKYLTSCKTAVETNLTWQLKDRLHFLENTDRYSLQDLIDLKAGILLPQLQRLMSVFEAHITRECKICYGRGYVCELCDDEDVFFPFQTDIECCESCGTAVHLRCWAKVQQICQRCTRRQKRLAQSVCEEEEEEGDT